MKKFKYIVFNKPFNVLTQFTSEVGHKTLSDFNLPSKVYSAGRLDKDSEGLLVLTNDGGFNQLLTNPKFLKKKTYWVQVENIPSKEKLDKLSCGVKIKDYMTRPCRLKIIPSVQVWDRTPPIRSRKHIPTCWLEIEISEGKNRQIRRMTASIGHPTLRLIRVGFGGYFLKGLAPGDWKEVTKDEILKS